MAQTDLKKIPFLKLLNLEAIIPGSNSSTIFGNDLLVEAHHNADLANKNNSIETGYENFCVEKGTLKLFPSKDFDFIGKHVVCQKCCQKFASTISYKAHAGTDICVRTYNRPNLIYLKYKKRNRIHNRKKNKRKSKEDFDGHDLKRNLLNPEMLNTLQTRNKVYSTDTIHQRKKVKEKSMNNSDETNDEPSVKKPRGRPKKHIISNNVEVNIKKRGRPKKLSAVTVDSSNKNDNISSNNLEIDESEYPKKLGHYSLHYASNKNINEDGKVQSLFSEMKNITAKFWNLFNKELKPKFVDSNKYQYPTKYQTQNNAEERGDLSAEENETLLKIEELKSDFKFLSKQFMGKKEYPFSGELKFILKKINDKHESIKQRMLQKTDIKGSIPDDGKENIINKVENKTKIETNNKDFDKNEQCIGIRINNGNTVSSTKTMKIKDGCKSINCINEDNLKTSTVNKTPNTTNSVKNHLKDFGFRNLNPILKCEKCRKKYTSVAEWKLHCSEHLVKTNKTFLCTVCGHTFKVYKNFKTHVNVHKKSNNDKQSKNFICKICYKQYDYLRSYYTHIKNHINQ